MLYVETKQNFFSLHLNALKTFCFSCAIIDSHSYAGDACRNAFGHSHRMSVLFVEFSQNFKVLIVLINSMLSIFMKIYSVVLGQLHACGQWTNRTI